MKKTLRFLIIAVVLLSCQDEDQNPSPDTFCIFKRIVYTDPADIGKDNWIFIRCDPNPNYQIKDSNHKGYQSINCNCNKQP